MLKSDYNSPNDIKNPNQFVQDVQNGNMAAVSWVTPPPNASDHPPVAFQPGENFVTGIVNAIMNSSYCTGATFDEAVENAQRAIIAAESKVIRVRKPRSA